MPELPELEIVRDVLQARLGGRIVERVTLSGRGGPIVARDLTGRGFAQTLTGARIGKIRRRGKFMVFDLLPSADLHLVVNPKLTGQFQLAVPGAKKAGPVHVTLHFADPEEELRYVDRKRMGQLYLTTDMAKVPTYSDMGPDALAISQAEFVARLRRFRGEIKGVLAREQFVAGIGNAYADEILWKAKLHPYRKQTELNVEEIENLYVAMRETLLESIDKVRVALGEDVHLKPRDFFSVHMRGGKKCPRCGGKVSEISAGGKITNFCRTCQPGGLIRGM
ncbi:MAG: Fpg/Nei family DNA glycosylase [Chloroflexi bacterium]|nr:Fpg/Nei family DNA glycosylase [Chloroflexota bacterium]MCI0891817.1 Fpg/Nei family DNA glycosylase [Chloroflexota bacterium]MDK1045523.1 DNA-formamidopyrimidine glycosylase family protein [Anaerolineales bacterium]